MIRVILEVRAAPGKAIGVKEAIAQDLEKYGDVRVVSVEDMSQDQGEQLTLLHGQARKQGYA